MRIVTIRDLQMKTGELVRASAHEKTIVIDWGQPVALLRRPGASDLDGKPFPKRELHTMPKVKGDSTKHISRDRDGR